MLFLTSHTGNWQKFVNLFWLILGTSRWLRAVAVKLLPASTHVCDIKSERFVRSIWGLMQFCWFKSGQDWVTVWRRETSSLSKASTLWMLAANSLMSAAGTSKIGSFLIVYLGDYPVERKPRSRLSPDESPKRPLDLDLDLDLDRPSPFFDLG